MDYHILIKFLEVRKKYEEETRWELPWRIARWQTAALLNVHCKKTIKPEDLMELPSDKVKETPTAISEETEEVWERWDKERAEIFGEVVGS